MKTRALHLILAVALAACGGGGGGPAGPQADVGFPFEGALTGAPHITVRGTAGADAVSVRVNGVAATSTDGFATWSATVPLAPGRDEVVVATEDAGGNVRSRAASFTVERQQLLFVPSDIDYDPVGDRYILTDRAPDRILAFDPATGNVTIVADEFRGSGPPVDSPGAVVVDAPNGRAFVRSRSGSMDRILAVDLATGDRTVVSDGTGPELEWVSDLALDTANNRILALQEDGLLAVDLATGDRTSLAAMSYPQALALDEANARALVIVDDTIVAVAFAGGTTVLSDDMSPGPVFGRAADLVVDPARNAAIVLDSGRPSGLVEVDLATGARTARPIDLPSLSFCNSLTRDAAGRAVLVEGDDGQDRLIAVDPATGSATVLLDSGRGSGPWIDDPRDFAYDTRRNRFVVADPGSGSQGLLAVDLDTANRSVMSGDAIGTGPAIERPEGIVYDESNDRFLVTDRSQPALFEVDAATGDRRILSDAATGSGPLFEGPRDLDYDAANDRVVLLGASRRAVFSVDLATGDRTILSDAATGAGPEFESFNDVDLDLANGRALVSGTPAIVAVDLATGNRSIVLDLPSDETVRALWLDAANNRAIGVGGRTVRSVDLATGASTVIADETTGFGPQQGYHLNEVIVLPGSIFAYVLDDSTSNSIFAYDLETGDRVVFSK